MFYYSHGKIHYDDDDGFRLTVEVNQDLSNYYRCLVPKVQRVERPRYSAHITVVRPVYESPSKIRYWGNYEGEIVEFMYDHYIQEGKGYMWINCWCKRLEVIREELGLPNFSHYPLLPEGYLKTFHCTIGRYEEVFDFSSNNEAPEK